LTLKILEPPIKEVLEGYNLDELTVATACSHTSLQIFNGARKEGMRTLGIAVGKEPRFYEAFPLAAPDEFIVVDSWSDFPKITEELVERNAVVVPHGSFVEYLGAKEFAGLRLPTYGNRKVLEWESDCDKSRQWLESAGVKMPREIKRPQDIDCPVLVKYHGAKGGRGFFIARTPKEFDERIAPGEPYTIQEFIVGARYYLHYFYSPIQDGAYRLSSGSLQMLGADRRVESNIDELSRLGSVEELARTGIEPTFVVTGNEALVLRESLLPRVMDMGAGVVERSLELFGGMVGPFCLETICTDKLEFVCFEISARLVAGTNLFPSGSFYADYVQPGLSNGQRIVQELKLARKASRLDEATTDDEVIGHILFSKIKIVGDMVFEALALAPMAVIPEFQKQGIGSRLINAGIEKAREMGFDSIIVLGHEAYYPKFGFQRASRWSIKCPFEVPDDAFMAIELTEKALEGRAGTVQYPDEFMEDE